MVRTHTNHASHDGPNLDTHTKESTHTCLPRGPHRVPILTYGFILRNMVRANEDTQIPKLKLEKDRVMLDGGKSPINYFAYGSLMDPEEMRKEGTTSPRRVHAILVGYSLRFNKIASGNPQEGKANVVPNSGDAVEGILYESIADSVLHNLDTREGFRKENDRCNHYDKTSLAVMLDDGHEVQSIVYIANPRRVKEGLKPTKEYMSHLLGGRDMLSMLYIRKLESVETLD